MQRVLAARLLALLAGGTTAGCSQHDGTSSTAASSTTAGVCSSVGELRASVAELRDAPLVQEGVSALQSAFASVRPDVAQVVQDAQSQYAAQTEGPTADVAAVQTAVGQAEASPPRATLDAVVGSIGALADDVAALADDVSSTC
jgi:hypothetical protein